MRRRSSSKQSTRSSMEVVAERPKAKEEPHLSGAYIRSLVKQLSSSRPKEPMNPKSPDGDNLPQDPTDLIEPSGEAGQAQSSPPPPPPPPQPKKQVRRRLHTSRPYQERLLNMAEARREIVTALKYHRAAMKQAHEQQQKAVVPPSPPHLEDPYQVFNTGLYSPNSALPNQWNSDPPFLPITYPSPNSWPHPPISPLPISDNLINFPLPSQPLGLSLNFQGFNNLDTPLYNKPSPSSSSSSYSYYSPSSPPPPPPMLSLEAPSSSNGPPPRGFEAVAALYAAGDPALHPVMDDEEMAEIRSIGEQHDMQWNDTVNVVTSAWWCKFLKTMDANPGGGEGDGGLHMFDQVMEIPAWLSDAAGGDGGDSSLLPHHLNDYQTDDYMQDTAALPRMDIGEIDGLDGEWLS